MVQTSYQSILADPAPEVVSQTRRGRPGLRSPGEAERYDPFVLMKSACGEKKFYSRYLKRKRLLHTCLSELAKLGCFRRTNVVVKHGGCHTGVRGLPQSRSWRLAFADAAGAVPWSWRRRCPRRLLGQPADVYCSTATVHSLPPGRYQQR